MFDLEPTITLPWLVRLRWLFVVAHVMAWGGLLVVFDIHAPAWPFVIAIVVTAASNLALHGRYVRRLPPSRVMGSVLLVDVVVLTVLLAALGGATNPFTVMYLVYITLSAVVLSARWTTVIASLSIVGFALLFAVPAPLHVHHHTGPIHMDRHLQGMWAAFVVAAMLTAFFVRRISRAIAVQREQIASLRETSARNARLAALATLAAGAAHELNNPLSSIAVAAHEASLRAKQLAGNESVSSDLQLITEQVDRCQRILHQMAARAATDESDDTVSPDKLADLIRAQLGDRAARVDIETLAAGELVLPAASIVQSVAALVKNALDASADTGRVRVVIDRDGSALVFAIEDHGSGISEDVLKRVGEPFFTTKAPGRGLGLGVFLARVFFESRGGTLSIESREGVGTFANARIPVTT